MSGRGRGGRGGGRGGVAKTFSKEQLNSMGASISDMPGPVTQPPPLFPPLNRKPVPINVYSKTNVNVCKFNI